MSKNKPYKILVRSPKGCVYDKLLCVKCCDTVLRGNYTAHKKTKKHIGMHECIEIEENEENRCKQIVDVIKYYKHLKDAK